MPNKTVVITGGNKGIGYSITSAFLESGWNVFVGSRTEGDLHKLDSSRLKHQYTDVRSYKSVKDLIVQAHSHTGSLDLLINNAGYSEWRPLDRIDEVFLEDIFATNLFSVFFACKAAASVMKTGASIINISSIAGKRGSSNNSAYVATKFAMNGLTQSLAKELGPREIRVNGICPVLISTDGLLSALNQKYSPSGSQKPSDFIAEFAASQAALKRLPTGEDVAAMCLFLASKASSSITGQNINVDCGVFPQ